jgi:DNA-directed RNA polymerase specialized sigma24 family protein
MEETMRDFELVRNEAYTVSAPDKTGPELLQTNAEAENRRERRVIATLSPRQRDTSLLDDWYFR